MKILYALYNVAGCGFFGLENLLNLEKMAVQGPNNAIKCIVKLHKHGIAPSFRAFPEAIF